MAGGTIKGIIVEIGGDTSGLQKALKNANSATSSLTKELRGINSLLKLDPSNTELVSQKQKVLAENIEQTTNKLEELRKVQEMANQDMSKISPENYRNLQREIINTENKLKDLQVQASKWTQAGNKLEAFGTKVTNISGKIENLGNTLTTSLTLPVLAIGTAAVTTGNNFEAQMSRVQAIAGATKDELELLTEQAIDLGASTSFSATQVALGMENLASAGFTTQEIMEAMPGLLDLAASSGAELATASEIAASAIRGFGLEASESAHVADVFAEASARTNAQVEDMGDAMKYIAPVANTMGLKIEEVAAAIGIMSDAGVKGEQSGTTLRGALVRLTKPTDKMIGVMEDLGISFYDSEGKMKSLTEMISMLQEATKDLTDEQEQNALTTLFGTESLSGMVALINRGSGDLADMTKSFETCDGAAQEMADTMLDNTKGSIEEMNGALESAGISIQKALAPEIRDLAKWVQDLVDDFNDLSDEEKDNIVKTALLVAAIGPAVKILGKLGTGLGTVTKGLGIFSEAVGLIGKTTTKSFQEASTSTQMLARGMTLLTSPIGIVATAITATVGVVVAQMKIAEKESKNSLSNIGESASDFVAGIDSAESHLSGFNSTLFATSEEQQKLQENMDEIQQGITNICKKASDERREYTQEEITQLDEYFKKLRELKNREIEIQQSIAEAISQQAITNSETFQGSLDEYKVQSQEWIKTAIEQKDATLKVIQDGTTQQIALLNQQYSTEESRRTEAYQKEYNDIMAQQQQKIDLANQEVAEVTAAYENGYLQRANQNNEFYATMQEYLKKLESEQERHNTRVEELSNTKQTIWNDVNGAIRQEGYEHNAEMKKISDEMYKNMSEEQEKELGVWLAQVAQTELYGGEISEETQQIVDTIIDSYDSMPDETREAMKNAMTPMLEEMENKEPSLFSKASGIANGILSRLKKAFDIHSPSKETRSIFQNVMKGAELGLEDERKKLNNQVDKIVDKMKTKFEGILPNYRTIKQSVIDRTQTIYTTPQITFNVQELDEAKLKQCFDYINRKFGSQY